MLVTLKSRLALALFCGYWFTLVLPVNASVMHDLYEARVAISDQTRKSQEAAVRQGFKQVLVKVSGTPALLASEQISRDSKRAKDYIRTYRFEVTADQLYFLVSFDAQRIEKMIRDAGFPVWDKRRPDTILWFALKDPVSGNRQFVTETDYPQLLIQSDKTANERGIKVVFPLLDLDDLQKVSSYDVWGGFAQQLGEASERYGVKNILSARFYPSVTTQDQKNLSSNGQWTADWTLWEAGRLFSGQVQQASVELTAAAVIGALADNLAARYAIDISKLDPSALNTQIKITNVNSLQQYADILNFFNGLSLVDKVSLIKQQGQVATFELDLLSGIDDFVNALALDNRLKPINEFEQNRQNLEYLWVL